MIRAYEERGKTVVYYADREVIMRTLKVTSENLHFFEAYLTEGEKNRLKTAKAMALGAAAGISPCAVVFFTVEAREAHLEKIYVEEGFRRRGVATGLIEQIGKRFPGLYKLSCSYFEKRYQEFDSLLKSRQDFFFEDERYSVYVVEKEEADSIKLPGGDAAVSEFFRMEEYILRKFMQTQMRESAEEIDGLLTGHAWAGEACLCHASGAEIDACLLTERTAEGLRLYFAYSGKNGAPAFLACFRKVLQMVRDGKYLAFEIVCRTERSQRLFEKLLAGREADGDLVTAYRYL